MIKVTFKEKCIQLAVNQHSLSKEYQVGEKMELLIVDNSENNYLESMVDTVDKKGPAYCIVNLLQPYQSM